MSGVLSPVLAVELAYWQATIIKMLVVLVIVPTAYSLVEGGLERLKQRPPRETRRKARRGKESPVPASE